MTTSFQRHHTLKSEAMQPDYPGKIFYDKRGSYVLLVLALSANG